MVALLLPHPKFPLHPYLVINFCDQIIVEGVCICIFWGLYSEVLLVLHSGITSDSFGEPNGMPGTELRLVQCKTLCNIQRQYAIYLLY